MPPILAGGPEAELLLMIYPPRLQGERGNGPLP